MKEAKVWDILVRKVSCRLEYKVVLVGDEYYSTVYKDIRWSEHYSIILKDSLWVDYFIAKRYEDSKRYEKIFSK